VSPPDFGSAGNGSPRGSLTVVGTGIQAGVHMTLEGRVAVEAADIVLYLPADPATEAWLRRLRPDARSLLPHYRAGQARRDVYEAIVQEILGAVRRPASVCAAFYGHPGAFVDPSHEAIRRARAEGFQARMLPAISAEDCLFADLGINPGRTGLQSYEATDFLIHPRNVDTSSALILWQVSVIGERGVATATNSVGLKALTERLLDLYPRAHEVTLYEASPYPLCSALIRTLPLSDLTVVEPTPLATLYVPPRAKRRPDPGMIERLGFAR
jgi:uncharacterized protein YabN with tetrapyrrole methylase and pyrophosphatase domain